MKSFAIAAALFASAAYGASLPAAAQESASEFDCALSQIDPAIGNAMVDDLASRQNLADEPAPYRDALDTLIEDCAAATTSTQEQQTAYRDVVYHRLMKPVLVERMRELDFDVERLDGLLAGAIDDPGFDPTEFLLGEYGAQWEEMFDTENLRVRQTIFLAVSYAYAEWRREKAVAVLAARTV